MKYEEVLQAVGSFGKFQCLVLLVSCLYLIPLSFNNMSIVFTGAIPDHWCYVPEVQSLNLTVDDLKNLTIPREERDEEEVYSQCEMYSCANWTYTFQHLDDYNTSGRTGCEVVTCQNGWTYDQSVYVSTIVTDWDLVCDRKPLGAMSQSVYMGGLMVGVLLSGFISDWIGRKISVVAGMIILYTFTVATSFSPNFITFVILRFIVAIGTIASYTSAFVLGIEMVGPEWRTLAGLLPSLFWVLGNLVVVGLSYGIRRWDYYMLAFAVPLVVLFPLLLLLPESPRWLYSKNKTDKGKAILQKIAKWNNKQLPDKLDIDRDDPKKKTYPWEICRYPRVRIRTTIIYFNWCVVSLVYYGLSLNTSNLGGDDHLNFLISVLVEIPAYSFLKLTLDRLGRRSILCFLMLLGGLSLMFTLAVPKDKDLHWVTIVLTMVGKSAITGSFIVVYVFTSELFPTTMRNLGLGSSSFWARVGAVIAPQVALLGTYNKTVPPVVFGVLAVVVGLLAVALPETAHQELPETIIDAENFGRDQSKAAVAPQAIKANNDIPMDSNHI